MPFFGEKNAHFISVEFENLEEKKKTGSLIFQCLAQGYIFYFGRGYVIKITFSLRRDLLCQIKNFQ